MMGRQVITTESFLTGIGVSEEVQGDKEVTVTHGVGIGILVVAVIGLVIGVVVGVTEAVVVGLVAQETAQETLQVIG